MELRDKSASISATLFKKNVELVLTCSTQKLMKNTNEVNLLTIVFLFKLVNIQIISGLMILVSTFESPLI